MAQADSAFIQEWPKNKLTVAQLRALMRGVGNVTAAPDTDLGQAIEKMQAALDKAEEGGEPERKAESAVYFFGCLKGLQGFPEAGHYFYREPTANWAPIKGPWLGEGTIPKTDIKIDGGFCPSYSSRSRAFARAKLTHFLGWTAVGFWDSSGDTRPGSDSNFFMRGTLSFEDAMEEVRRAFGPVVQRIEDKYGPITCVERHQDKRTAEEINE